MYDHYAHQQVLNSWFLSKSELQYNNFGSLFIQGYPANSAVGFANNKMYLSGWIETMHLASECQHRTTARHMKPGVSNR